MSLFQQETKTFAWQPAVTKAATASGTALRLGLHARDLIVTWNITAAERDSADETYDLYITTSDGVSSWDIAHFPQVLATGAKTFTAIISGYVYPQNVSTAAPGVQAVTTATLATATGQANVIKTLGAGLVRHGPWGDRINWELVVAGTVVTGISFSIQVLAK